MKKSLVLVLIVLFVAAGLFADAGVGGWGRVITQITGSDADDSDVMFDMAPNWSGNGGRVRHDVFGNGDNVGFRAEVDGNMGDNFYSASYGVGEFLYVYAMPVEMLKLSAGKFQIDTMRGGIGAATGTGTAYFSGDLEDMLFSRMRTNDGLAAAIMPAEGVDILALISGSPAGGDSTMEDATKTIQVGAQYKIEGVGRIRAQYIGENTWGGSVASEDVQAAFEYTGMDGLKVDAGLKYDLSDAEDPTKITVAGTYAMDKINATLAAELNVGDDFDARIFAAGIYSLENSMSARLEVAYQMMEDDNKVCIYPYVQKGLSNGKMTLGFKFEAAMDAEVNTWALPLMIEYWF